MLCLTSLVWLSKGTFFFFQARAFYRNGEGEGKCGHQGWVTGLVGTLVGPGDGTSDYSGEKAKIARARNPHSTFLPAVKWSFLDVDGFDICGLLLLRD